MDDRSGIYNVKSSYELLLGESQEVEGNIFSKLCPTKALSSSIALAWRVLLNKIQSKSDLARRNAFLPNSEVDCVVLNGGGKWVSFSFLFFMWLGGCGLKSARGLA